MQPERGARGAGSRKPVAAAGTKRCAPRNACNVAPSRAALVLQLAALISAAGPARASMTQRLRANPALEDAKAPSAAVVRLSRYAGKISDPGVPKSVQAEPPPDDSGGGGGASAGRAADAELTRRSSRIIEPRALGPTEEDLRTGPVRLKVNQADAWGSGQIPDIKKAAEEHLKKAKKEWEEKTAEIREKGKRHLMKKIDIMRAELCWDRPNFWEHKKCLKYLGVKCARGSTGAGICSDMVREATERCKEPKRRYLKKVCRFFEKIGLVDEKKPDDDEGKREKAEEDEQKKATGEHEEGEEDAETVGKNESSVKGEDEEGAENETDKEVAKVIADMDKDGVPDDKDPDRDNDGYKNEDDAFPNNTMEWGDIDKDGIGDNADEDRDGDGRKDKDDAFPDDPKEWSDLDKDGVGDNSDNDGDGDGWDDKEDNHPGDPSLPKDLDDDRIPDHKDSDIDGDGVANKEDVNPADPSEGWPDADNDGHIDKEDAFPNDANEWKDTDEDGVGDGADKHPRNPNCTKSPCVDPDDVSNKMNKVGRPLPPDGYDEHSPGTVQHEDMQTYTDDWREEWPQRDEDPRETVARICAEEPDNDWCRRHGFTP